MAEEHASPQVVIQVRSYVRLHVLPSPALKAVVLAYESLLFDAQRPDIKYEIFVKFEICCISILLVSRRWRRRLSRGLRWTRRGLRRSRGGLGPEWRVNPAER